MLTPPGYRANDLRFEDDFDQPALDLTKWNPYITSNAAHGLPWNGNGSGGSGLQHPLAISNLEYDLPSQLSVGDGLVITAQEASTQGMLGQTPKTYPWRSGAVSTYGKFETLGGYVQIEAKMPGGDGMWPSLWMLPGPGGSQGDNFEVDIFEGGFLDNGSSPTENDSWHLSSPVGLQGGVVDLGVDTTAAYHVYGLKWVPGRSLTWYFDGRVIGLLTSAQSPIPDEPMELIMNLAVGNNAASSFRIAAGPTTPSSARMLVHEVQVYA